jgi:hypothetical protein
LLVSIKFFDDIYYNNTYYAKIGGISLLELNQLEKEFISNINYDLYAD